MTSPLRAARAADAELESFVALNRRQHDRAVQRRMWVLLLGGLSVAALAIFEFGMNGGAK
jgi:hypothetical protein